MKNSFFHADNWLWQPFGKITDFLILSVLWLFSCIPVVTVGAAFTALYDCSAHCVKNGEKGMVSRYLRTYRRELIPSALSFLLWAMIIGIVFSLIRGFTGTANPTPFNLVITYAATLILIFVVGTGFWVFPLLSRFTFNVISLNLTAIRLAIIYFPSTILLGICTCASIWLCLRLWIPIMIVPGIYGLLATHILEPVFKKYEEMQQDKNEN